PLPYKFSASPMIFAQSGSRYNITAGTPDSVTLGYSDRPAFAPGVTAATANCFNASSFSNATPYVAGGTNNQIPVDLCTGPANVSFNLRLSRTFGIGPKVEPSANAAQGGPGGGPGGPGGMGGGPGEAPVAAVVVVPEVVPAAEVPAVAASTA